MFGITAQAAEQEEGLEDLSGIRMQPWMREGVPAELGGPAADTGRSKDRLDFERQPGNL